MGGNDMRNWVRPTRTEWYSFIIPMPFIDLALNFILYGRAIYTDSKIWLISFPLIFVIGIASWYSQVAYNHFIEGKFPSLADSTKRILAKSAVYLLIMSPSVLVIFFLYDRFHILGYSLQIGDLKWGLITGVTVNLVFIGLWEAIYIIDKYKESLAEKEMLEKMGTEQEFENLKSQVNPHFLFNCFNTLSSLIEVDRSKAEIFLDELSKVYRYLLRNNEDGISTVENEIKFIQSYYQLLKTRYGDGLNMTIEIDKRYYPYLLPSLSLQLLVENAVKHNIVSKQQPLTVEIFTTAGNKLVVNNNLQKKQQKEHSTNIGLNNIRSKYSLMKQKGFQIIEGEKNFMAVLPLIWNEPKNF
ncbi:MAG: histidine kinase [Chitinophagaceae bacterium]